MTVRFDVSKKDLKIIERIAVRAVRIADGAGYQYMERDVQMDLAACHCNGCPLQLTELLDADDFNFSHDIFGIRRHLNRTTGKLDDRFLPRFAR